MVVFCSSSANSTASDPGIRDSRFIGFLLWEAAGAEPKLDLVRDADVGSRTGAGRLIACGRCLVAVDGSVHFSFTLLFLPFFFSIFHFEYLLSIAQVNQA